MRRRASTRGWRVYALVEKASFMARRCRPVRAIARVRGGGRDGRGGGLTWAEAPASRRPAPLPIPLVAGLAGGRRHLPVVTPRLPVAGDIIGHGGRRLVEPPGRA